MYWVLYVTLLLFLLTPLNNLKDMASSGEACGMEESSSSTPKISLLDHVNGFHYNALKKSDNFVIDMDAFSHGINKDSTNDANSRITVSFFFFNFVFFAAMLHGKDFSLFINSKSAHLLCCRNCFHTLN